MSKKPKKKKNVTLKSHRNKTQTERKQYWRNSSKAPDLGKTGFGDNHDDRNETEIPVPDVPGIPATGGGRHRLNLNGIGISQKTYWEKNGNSILVIVNIITFLFLIGAFIYSQGKISSERLHTQSSLNKMEKYSEERRKLLTEVDKRLFSIENKIRVLDQLSKSSPLIANDLITLKTLVQELRYREDNNLKKFQIWTEQQLSKIEQRLDAIWGLRDPNKK